MACKYSYSDLPSHHTLPNQLSKRLDKYVLNPPVVLQDQTNLTWEAEIVNMQFLRKRLVKKSSAAFYITNVLHRAVMIIKHHREKPPWEQLTCSTTWTITVTYWIKLLLKSGVISEDFAHLFVGNSCQCRFFFFFWKRPPCARSAPATQS